MQLFGSAPDPVDDDTHLAWLARQRDRLLDFYQPDVRLDSGGYAYLDAHGEAMPEQGAQLWLGARMLHCFSLAHMLGRDGADEVVRHGLEFYLRGAGRDHEHGGWYATVGGDEPSDRKELYGQAQLLMGASTALCAGFEEAVELVVEALRIIDLHYWREDEGRCVEAYDRAFTTLDPYRGQNANMHLTEAFLAAHDATGDRILLERAARIAQHIAGPAADSRDGAWRLPEHFDAQWNPLPGYNRDEPRHPFRPYGSQPGHWLEWTKLLLQLRGQGVDEPWLMPAARNLFDGALRDGWATNGGFVYTVDWDGTPVVEEKYFWEPAEGVGAARYLHAATGEQRYAHAYRTIWEFIAAHVIDHASGSWHPELSVDNEPVVHTWPGRADLYHALQATLYASVPAEQGLARWAAGADTTAP